METLNFENIIKYFSDKPHQKKALQYLAQNTPQEVVNEFYRLWRNPMPIINPLVTNEQLKIIYPTVKELSKEELVFVNLWLDKIGVNTPLRLSHFFAQILHESWGLAKDEEVWGDTEDQLAYEMNKDLGNTNRGDGKRFLGRGKVCLTGRYNYSLFTKWVNKVEGDSVDFVANPELIAKNWKYSWLTAFWFWDQPTSLNKWADKDDAIGIRKAFNGGTNGLEETISLTKRGKIAFGA
ncbi:MAG: chitinase [Cyanobacteria bacterium M5B4]|nr:MAG: chitinase [Cyanobacteria bacterium M5B4]